MMAKQRIDAQKAYRIGGIAAAVAGILVIGFIGGSLYQSGKNKKDVVYLYERPSDPLPTLPTESNPAVVPEQFKHSKFYLNSDKSRYLQIPENWNIEHYTTQSTKTNADAKDKNGRDALQVESTIVLLNGRGDRITVYAVESLAGGRSRQTECIEIAQENMILVPENSKKGLFVQYEAASNEFVYQEIDKSCTDSNTSVTKYETEFANDGYKKNKVIYRGTVDGMKIANEFYKANFLTDNPIDLLQRTK
jgi:hypothetical protein